MQIRTKFLCLLIAGLVLFSPQAFSTNNPWKLINELALDTKSPDRQIIPNRYLTYQLALDELDQLLAQTPLRFSPDATKKQVVLQIPMPDGSLERFSILEAPVMHPDLAKKYPMLRAFVGTGIDDPTASLRFDMTQFGFHGMILSGRHSGAFIDPYAKNDTEHYVCYYQKDFSKAVEYECFYTDRGQATPELATLEKNTQGDCMLRTYRLALACTGEYADFHGGTVPDVMAAFHTTMTRVNGIFERDASIHLELIPNTDELIFLDAATDPYYPVYPSENQFVCDNIIGSANYDIGHLLGIGTGGSAERSSCCVEGLKAEGYSTLSNPVGDIFDINFVCHEFGHQFGCSHTANGNCNSTLATSVEPGNAYSVMGQDFFCDPIIELVRGPYFHAVNLLEIAANVIDGPAGSCAILTDLGNMPPTVDVGNTHYYLPISTPFKLSAEGTDGNGDALTYCWEQMDNEEVVDPPIPTNAAGPAFRSYEPVETPERYFPALEYIVDGTDYLWEVLPVVSRVMNFRVTARDHFAGGGCTAEDDVDLTFTASAGPFVVQTPNTSDTWYQGADYTIAWEVANTDQAPVSCASVDILLSVDGGYTYPTVLATAVPNDGSQIITAPALATSMARVMVVCSDNIFFDISDENFSIETAVNPGFTVAIDPASQTVCGSAGSSNYTLNLSSLAGFEEEVTLSATNIPAGASLTLSQNPVSPTATVEVLIEGLENVLSGTYTLSIVGTTATVSLEEELLLTVNNDPTEPINLLAPGNGATHEPLLPTFEWEASNDIEYYLLEIASEPTFENALIKTALVNNNTYTLSEELAPFSVYYWRVLPENACLDPAAAVPFFSFQTGESVCKRFTNLEPTYIHGFINTASTTILVEEAFDIVDANISMEIFHKLVGDLKVTLTAPSGTVIPLFDRPGVPTSPFGCTADDLKVVFDDEAGLTASDFENSCTTGTDYAIEGTFQSIDPLSALIGQNAAGNWLLTVSDEKFSHSGAIDSWSLELCLTQAAGATPDFAKMDLWVPELGTGIVSTTQLLTSSTTANPEQITYTLLALPTEGDLQLDGQPVSIGTTFTQATINDNLLTYTNTNPVATTDEFQFDIKTQDGHWIPNEFLTIHIGEMTEVNETNPTINFELFPIPSNQHLTLSLNQPTAEQISISIYDLTGRRIHAVRLEKSGLHLEERIDISAFPAGGYLIFLTDGQLSGRKIFLKI